MPSAAERADELYEQAVSTAFNPRQIAYRTALGAGVGAMVGAIDKETTVVDDAKAGALYGFAYHTVSSLYGVLLSKIAQRAARRQ